MSGPRRGLPHGAPLNTELLYYLAVFAVMSAVIIGAGGVERVVEIKLNGDEQAMFDKSVEAVKGLCDACKAIDSSLV